jgi:gamma-glutamylcysteine synthetase
MRIILFLNQVQKKKIDLLYLMMTIQTNIYLSSQKNMNVTFFFNDLKVFHNVTPRFLEIIILFGFN